SSARDLPLRGGGLYLRGRWRRRGCRWPLLCHLLLKRLGFLLKLGLLTRLRFLLSLRRGGRRLIGFLGGRKLLRRSPPRLPISQYRRRQRSLRCCPFGLLCTHRLSFTTGFRPWRIRNWANPIHFRLHLCDAYRCGRPKRNDGQENSRGECAGSCPNPSNCPPP